jgi:hypothetical protein
VSKKAYLKRIERLEAFVRSLKIEDAKKRHLESLAKMSDEEKSSVTLFAAHYGKVWKEDPHKADELFRSGLAALEQLDEGARFGWRAYCETGGQAAMVDFSDAHEDKGSTSRTPGLKGDLDVLFEGVVPRSRRPKASKLAQSQARWEAGE